MASVDESLTGQLLIAAPSLHDFFRRTVVLMVEHNDEGAFGVVLNRPSEAAVAEVVPSLAPYADAEEVVWIGGPVATDTAVAIGRFDDPAAAAGLVVGDLGVIDPDGTRAARLRRAFGLGPWPARRRDRGGRLDRRAGVRRGPVPRRRPLVLPARPSRGRVRAPCAHAGRPVAELIRGGERGGR
jgi:putative transcriptional regulator